MKCTRCGVEHDRLVKKCEACNQKDREYGRVYRERHAEREKERHKKYHLEFPGKVKESVRKNYEKNRDKRLAQTNAYYHKNKGRYAEVHKNWYENNKSEWLEKCKAYRLANPDKIHAKKMTRRAREKAAFVSVINRADVFERDGYICQICGEGVIPWVASKHPHYPTVDHIIPLAKGGKHEFSNVQCAHMGCNARKGDKLL